MISFGIDTDVNARNSWREATGLELANVRKHQVSFKAAKTFFHYEFAIQFFDEGHSSSKDRFLLLGMSSDSRLLLLFHCEREEGDVVRIISARKATHREAAYEGR